MKPIIGLIGAGKADKSLNTIAEEVGRLIALKGALLVCGGLGGVMESASKGAKSAGGTTIGILPQNTKDAANQHIDIPIATGFGEGRNIIIIRTADALIAVGGEFGTLSEIAYALKLGKPIVGISTWNIDGITRADTPEAAVEKVFELLESGSD